MDFSVSVDHREKIKESGKRDDYLDIAKVVEHEDDGDSSCNWPTWNCPQRLGKGPGKVNNREKNRNHSNYSIAEIGKNTEKSSGDLKDFAVTRISMRDYLPMMV